MLFSENGKDKEEIRQIIGLVRKAIRRLNEIWWHKDITESRIWHIYSTIVKRIILYGAETWNMTEADKEKLWLCK